MTTRMKVDFEIRSAYLEFLKVRRVLNRKGLVCDSSRYQMRKGERKSFGEFFYSSNTQLPEESELLGLLGGLNVMGVSIN